jgi:hypothetical protein
LLIVDNFFKSASVLRQEFDTLLDTARPAQAGRFVWDYWHVPNQYSHLRTPAGRVFKKSNLERFQQHLLNFGKENLGCVGITPAWLSCYINGCKQGWHADVPHGPFAFVFSLTNWQNKKFTGGETWIMKDAATDFWPNFHKKNGIEEDDLFEKIVPRFNRLVVFDPRRPHSVSEVRGTQDPLEGRLVMHGWFTHPQPFLEGGLSRRNSGAVVESLYDRLFPLLKRFDHLHGISTFRLNISKSGEVRQTQRLISTLVSMDNQREDKQKFFKEAMKLISDTRFPKASSATRLTLPLVFY